MVSRGFDQFALGLTSLLLARRTGTEAFAPFATLYIVYALSGQVADGGLAFAVLRTPSVDRVRRSSRMIRTGVNLGAAIVASVVGQSIGGSVGTVVTASGWIWLAGSLSYVGRATLQWADLKPRLARAEAGSALVFFALVVAFVRDADGLAALGFLLAGKNLLEFVLQGLPSQIFERVGNVPRAGAEWVGQLVTYAVANIDYLLIGALLGPVALSVYAVGFRLASAFSSVVASPLTRSAFVQYANSESLQAVNDRIVRQVLMIGTVGVAVTVVGAPLLPLALGPGWEGTSRITLILGLALPWRLLLGPTVALGISTGRARSVIVWELVRFVVLAAAVTLFATDVIAVAGAAAGATIASIAWSHHRATRGSGVVSSPLVPALSVVAVGVVAVLTVLS